MADDSLITTPEQAKPEWLTERLRRSGILPQGEVVAVDYSANGDAFNSAITHMTLTYAPDAPSEAPTRLVLKLNDRHWGAEETQFYQLVATARLHAPMLVRCFDIAYSAETGCSHLLLEDHSATHSPPVTRARTLAGDGVPPDWQMEGIIESLARFHALFWEHPWLGKGVAEVRPWYRHEADHRRHVARREREWAQFRGSVGAELSADLHALYERALAALPRLWDRYLARRVTALRQITLSNGDCYLAQFLCPLVPSPPRQTYLIDWQAASANLAAYDLIYLMPTFWTPAQRRESDREMRLLRRYHGALESHGVRRYALEDLLVDYRLMLAYMVFDPIWDQTSGASPTYWWPKLRCLTAAYTDLDCDGLLS